MRFTTKLTAICFAISAVVVGARADTTTTKTFSNWKVLCVEKDSDKSKQCLMSQTLVNSKTKQAVFTLALRKNQKGEFLADVQVPLGGDLASGLSLTVDDAKPVTVAYKRCIQIGCLAEFTVGDGWKKILGTGKAFKATITGPNDQAVPFSVDLKNFSEAFDSLTTQLQ